METSLDIGLLVRHNLRAEHVLEVQHSSKKLINACDQVSYQMLDTC